MHVTWHDNTLRVRAEQVPGGEIEMLYLEAFCRRGSTRRDWRETILPFATELIEADRDGRHLTLRTVVDDTIEIMHDVRAGDDDVAFEWVLSNPTSREVGCEWAQPCLRVDRFTERGPDDYIERSFVFTTAGLTFVDRTHRATEALYTPGQVYVPEGIDLDDVNPRPLSRTRPINGLIGCVSADGRRLLATAWSHTHELFQGIYSCLHADVHIGGVAPGQTKRRHGRLYLLPNDPAALLDRYARDFPPRRDAPGAEPRAAAF